MSLSQLIKPDAILATLRVNGKKQALQEMSERAALVSGLPDREIFDAILQRERLGSTARSTSKPRTACRSTSFSC